MKVLATNHDPAGAMAIAPVIKRLRQEGKVEVAVVGTGYSKDVFSSHGIGFRDDASYGDFPDVSYLARKILETEKPEILLTGTSRIRSLEKELTVLGRKTGIKSLAVLDYWSNYWQRFSNLETGNRFEYLPDKIAVMDELAKKEMVAEGFPQDTIAVTGNPHFDDIKNSKHMFTDDGLRTIRKNLSVNQNQNVVTFVSETNSLDYGTSPEKKGLIGEYLGFTEADSLKGLVNAMISISEQEKDKYFLVIVKLHPREENAPFYPDNLPENMAFKVIKKHDPREVIMISELVVGMASALIFEAGIMGKPVISYQPNLRLKDNAIGNRIGLSIPVYSEGGLLPLLQRVLVKHENIIKKKANNTIIDGKATDRVVKEIYKMLGEP
ncbi:MAG: CDP-glycerol glycerophosphotransferase family protein [Candidatus Methanoperedens sp.]|nr:CDP-glycerol glycerophosphotransferase family protein [Candidatus Methanoperedens sp.]